LIAGENEHVAHSDARTPRDDARDEPVRVSRGRAGGDDVVDARMR
jgi:hypothetical protein